MGNSPTFQGFNPSGNETVAAIKAKTDEIIGIVKDSVNNNPDATPEQKRRAALAATNYEQAAMWAVKAQFDR